jgi:hypothetical protein
VGSNDVGSKVFNVHPLPLFSTLSSSFAPK